MNRDAMRTVWLCALVVVLTLIGVGQPAQPPGSKPESPPAAEEAVKKPSAPRTLTLEFRKEGERWWWAEDAKGNPLNIPQKLSEKKATLTLPEGATILWLLDSETGNLARLPAESPTESKSQPEGKAPAESKPKTAAETTRTITSDDWTHVARLQVNIRAGERPVATALVTVKGEEGYQQTQVLEPTAEGILIFERVPLGKVTVGVRYGDEQEVSQQVRLKVAREERVPVINIALIGEVATLTPPKTSKPESAPTGSRIGAIVMFLIVLALAIGVIVLLVRLALQREKPLGEAMQRLGVQLPSADSGGTAASSTGTIAPPEPDLPPLETAGVAPTVATFPSPTATPTRLVGLQGAYAGQVFELGADLVTIGREVGNTIVLDGETTVSRRHAQLMRQNGELLVQDLGSTNGTFVNGQRISASTSLRVGDTVQFGTAVFKVE